MRQEVANKACGSELCVVYIAEFHRDGCSCLQTYKMYLNVVVQL